MLILETLGHPSVLYSHSAGAIGVLAVKKSTEGIYFYFSHNTDSFVGNPAFLSVSIMLIDFRPWHPWALGTQSQDQ